MKLTLSALALAALFATSAQGQSISYPVTRKVDQVDAYHDPGLGVGAVVVFQPAVGVVQQNEVTDKFLAAMPQRLPVRKLYTEL